MAESETESEYKQAFIARVREARKSLGWKQWQMAEALGGMTQDRYKQYESRSLLPHHLVGRFCIITRRSPEWLVTGRGEKYLKPPELVADTSKEEPRPRKARKPRAA